LNDGTRVFLNTATQIVVNYDDAARRVELKTGEALFNVMKDPRRPFIVTVGGQEVRALGTSFVIRKDSDRVAVTLVEGKVSVQPVAVASPSYQTFTLTPGQRVTFAVGAPPQLDTPSIETSTAWRRGQVVLDDTPLATAASEMNRYSAVKVVIVRADVERLQVSGLFQAGDSVSFANAVARVHDLQVTQEGDEIILSTRNND
jgi:transmembrane sensor